MKTPPSIKSIFENKCLPRLEQYVLLECALKKNRAWLIAHQETILTNQEFLNYNLLRDRRLMGEPIAYLRQCQEFMGSPFFVKSGVLIPRPETELLVEQALKILELYKKPKVADLGTGSGIVAISIALFRPDLSIWACDIDPIALDVAYQNSLDLGVLVNFFQGDWLKAFGERGDFDLIVSNPPYISCSDPHLRKLTHFEPRNALTDEHDGLKHIRQIISSAKFYLKSGGSLWIEHGWNQAKTLRMLFRKEGFSEIKSLRDLSNIERISGGILQKID